MEKPMEKPIADCLFEVSWEVCNKVGGIYTVLTTKAGPMMDLYRNYYLVGPYFEMNARIAFRPEPIPNEFNDAFDDLSKEGIKCHFGKWNDQKNKPYVILIDFSGLLHSKNDIKGQYWMDFGIDSLRGNWDFEEPSMWSYAVGKMISRLSKNMPDRKIAAQFHEWLSAFGLLYLKKNNPEIGTVFTTHATMLGRSIAGSGLNLYDIMNNIDPTREAYNFGIEAKHLTERAAAINADIFTTVSEITALEADKFLGRRAEVLVLNGLDIDKFPSFEQTSIKHIASRDKIREFLTYYFFPYYSFDLNHNLIFYTVGRFEFRNKGYDILIRALGKLNYVLKNEYSHEFSQIKIDDASKHDSARSDASRNDTSRNDLIKSDIARSDSTKVDVAKTVSVFFWIPMENHGLKLEVLENKNYYMHIKNYITANAPDILTRLVYDFISHKENVSNKTTITNTNLFSDTFINEINKDILAFERLGSPSLATHNIDENNILLSSLRNNGLMNRPEDLIKVVVEPVYLDGTDGFVDLAYYDAMVGCHLGLFPSYYEPWGYTPLESAALGVPALTTDMSGFGMFVKNNIGKRKGLMVLERFKKSEDEVVEEFTKMLYDFVKLNHSQRVECKLDAKEVSATADWKFLVENYVRAHNLALKKKVGF